MRPEVFTSSATYTVVGTLRIRPTFLSTQEIRKSSQLALTVDQEV